MRWFFAEFTCKLLLILVNNLIEYQHIVNHYGFQVSLRSTERSAIKRMVSFDRLFTILSKLSNSKIHFFGSLNKNFAFLPDKFVITRSSKRQMLTSHVSLFYLRICNKAGMGNPRTAKKFHLPHFQILSNLALVSIIHIRLLI